LDRIPAGSCVQAADVRDGQGDSGSDRDVAGDFTVSWRLGRDRRGLRRKRAPAQAVRYRDLPGSHPSDRQGGGGGDRAGIPSGRLERQGGQCPLPERGRGTPQIRLISGVFGGYGGSVTDSLTRTVVSFIFFGPERQAAMVNLLSVFWIFP